jgi:cytoskeleton protein RodZ
VNIHLIEIGQALKSARESSGLKIDEVSNDLEIPVLVLEQIEEGSIGAFKDIFKLKEYLKFYSRYLGLDEDEIIDEFNEYMFEKTSKIPMDEIEKVIKEKTEEEDRLASPYTKAAPKSSDKQFVLIVLLIIILVIIAIFWSVKQIT